MSAIVIYVTPKKGYVPTTRIERGQMKAQPTGGPQIRHTETDSMVAMCTLFIRRHGGGDIPELARGSTIGRFLQIPDTHH